MSLNLSPEQARIFRITHIDNMPWILRNGLHCPSSATRDPNFVMIGNPDIIGKRTSKCVPIPPDGVLEDYVPFYFTPCSVMLYNIVTGYNGLTRRDPDDIVIMVSSVARLQECGVDFVFTDRHALVQYAKFFSDVSALDTIDWELLRARDFARSDKDPGKVERYQAEVLAHQSVPVEALLGIACYSEASERRVLMMLAAAGSDLRVEVKRDWFF
ncbi:DUF4433 domain-containing protein [Coriobacteriia bacterium Es71-Z0120]|uniref:type II toxin-antitoxin system toxin DNA ADP-ribosyl transferase DarT n=1 Tax=Parvivirga hydrogeniphila TaxID=2939460 RepID=UPI002260B154|nr:DUF4433 domain-containing protein [Parvivirga hydrogeniphila]MCL4079460.1 DUF4433 domain-containing protein [Parvivirga hydrogeniphila]